MMTLLRIKPVMDQYWCPLKPHTPSNHKSYLIFASGARELNTFIVDDDKFRILECWYIDVSQCISLLTKEPIYHPDLLNLTPNTNFQFILGGCIWSTMKQIGGQNYNRLVNALCSHIFHTKIWYKSNCTKILQKLQAHTN